MKTITLLICGFVVFDIASSQEIGLSASHLWTDNNELQNPNGFGVHLSKNLSEYFSLKLAYEYIYNERNYYGTVSSGMEPNPVWESIQTYADANLWKLSFAIIPYRSEMISLSGGFTVSGNSFETERKGEQTGLHYNSMSEFKFGIGYFVLLQFFPALPLPIVINFNGSRETMTQSFTRITDVAQPFYNSINIYRIQIGIGYVLK